MSDQAFPGQPLNDEWLFADPEKLILIQKRTDRREVPYAFTGPREKSLQLILPRQRDS